MLKKALLLLYLIHVHGKQESYKLHGRVQRKKNLKFLGGLQ
jgi:hypothetical protein